MVTKEYKPCAIYRRICNVYREACFSQKIFMKWNNTDSPVKKMFWAQWLVKVMLTVFGDLKEPMNIDFH